jgi:hypothetical protein
MLNPVWYPDAKQLRQFALISVIGFPLLGWLFTGRSFASFSTTTFQVFAAIGIVVCLVGLIAPNAIRPIYALLMLVAVPIGWLISNLFLRIIFYLVLTPLGLIFRLKGRDPLWLHKPAVESFWQSRRPRADLTSYYRQA